MPAVGEAVHFYTHDAREQWRSVGPGPYAAIVTAHGKGAGRLNLYVLPAIEIMSPRFFADVMPEETPSGSRWWKKIT